MASHEDEIVGGLTDRLRNLVLTLDRQDRLESARVFVGWLGRRREEGALPEDAREVFLRALRAASDPLNFRILEQLDLLAPVELSRLMGSLGLERVALSERVNDLLQAGLAVRELVNDQVHGTALGQGLVTLVHEISRRAGDQLAADLTRGALDA